MRYTINMTARKQIKFNASRTCREYSVAGCQLAICGAFFYREAIMKKITKDNPRLFKFLRNGLKSEYDKSQWKLNVSRQKVV
jgi:hypothetical protein